MNETHFASAERSTPNELERDFQAFASSELMTLMLRMSGRLLAVLNDKRQVVGLNTELLTWLGAQEEDKTLGLRLGELVHCKHANEKPAGCGTTTHCASCGAAIATVAALNSGRGDRRTCILRASRNEAAIDICLGVRSEPLRVGGRQFVLLLLDDQTDAQRRAVIERIFFHDLSNAIAALSYYAAASPSDAALCTSSEVTSVKRQVSELIQVVRLNRALIMGDLQHYIPFAETLSVALIFQRLERFFQQHPAAAGKRLHIEAAQPSQSLVTDGAALHQVLVHMVTNALEASAEGEEVRVWTETTGGAIVFHVWNKRSIPPTLALRIFQRNFSTKATPGAGMGTYAEKLICEGILGGQIEFLTSENLGTTFSVRLPHPQNGAATRPSTPA